MRRGLILVAFMVMTLGCAGTAIQQTPSQADACTSSGGTVTTSMACKGVEDYVNGCAIGSAGCAPADSRSITTCKCAVGNCWDGNTCVKSK